MKLKYLLIISYCIFTYINCNSQNLNSVSAGIGVFPANTERFKSDGLSVYFDSYFVYKVGYARYLDNVTRLRFDFAMANYKIPITLGNVGNTVDWNGRSINIGPQFRFLKLDRLHLHSGFVFSYLFFNSKEEGVTESNSGSELSYALNPLSVSVLLGKNKNFSIDVDSYINYGMHTHMYIGISYLF